MHIVIDGTSAIHGERAIRRYAYHLIEELCRLESPHEITVLYLADRASAGPKPPLGAERCRSRSSRMPGRLLRPAMRVLRFPRVEWWTRRPSDLVHFPGGLPSIPHGAPVTVSTLHGLAFARIPHLLSDAKRRELQEDCEQSVAKGTHFITVSETSRREAIELFGLAAERVRAIPLGVSPEFRRGRLAGEAEERLRAKHGVGRRRVALFVGTLEPHKNIHRILEAFSEFDRRARGTWHLLLVGPETPHVPGYRAQIEALGLRELVSFGSFLPPGSTELADLYDLAEMLVFPTCYEGWASPPLEAMISGTPVVASDLPSLRESTGGFALFADPEDAASIAGAMERLAEDRDMRERLIEEGAAFAAQFTWALCARRTLGFYEEALWSSESTATASSAPARGPATGTQA